jgi:hypothetical protein
MKYVNIYIEIINVNILIVCYRYYILDNNMLCIFLSKLFSKKIIIKI